MNDASSVQNVTLTETSWVRGMREAVIALDFGPVKQAKYESSRRQTPSSYTFLPSSIKKKERASHLGLIPLTKQTVR